MQTRLTLRIEAALVERARRHARKTGKSVSGLAGDFFSLLGTAPSRGPADLPPTVRSLVGVLRGRRVDERDHRRHLAEKHR